MVNIAKNLKELFKKKKKTEEVEAATVVHLETAEEPVKEELKQPQVESKKETKSEVEKREIKDEKEIEADEKAEGDSIVSDISKLKSLIKKSGKEVEKIVGPKVSRGLKKASESAAIAGSVIKLDLLKRIIQGILIVGIMGVIAYLGIRGFNYLKKDVEEEGLKVPSPTPASYQPYKPSIYAEDPEVLAIEETINVLKREVSLTNIRETTLNPPSLDFKIEF